MTSPVPTPLPNAVTHESRTAIRLNTGGSAEENPIIGTARYEGSNPISGEGINIRLKFTLTDAAETILAATIQQVNDEGVPVGANFNIKSLFVRDIVTLQATANLVAGKNIASGSVATRSIIRIKTNRNRTIQQELWVRDSPVDIVTLRGQVTTSSTPLQILLPMIDIGGALTASFRTSFFSSWNDEVARQHGAQSVNLASAIKKPYGGAKTVEIFRITGPNIFNPLNLLLSERPVEEAQTLTWGPTANGEVLILAFRFRSLAGSNDSVVGFGWVQFLECDSLGGSPPTTSCPESEQKPCMEPGGATTFDVQPINGEDLPIDIKDFGDPPGSSDSYSEVRVKFVGYKGGVSDEDPLTMNAGFPIANVVTGTQEETFTTPGIKNVTIGSELEGASLIIATIEAGNASNPDIGTSVVFTATESDVGDLPLPPLISAVGYDFVNNEVDYTIDDFGWPDEAIDIHVHPLHGIVRGLAVEQSFEDISIDVDGSPSVTNIPFNLGFIGVPRSTATGLTPIPDAVAVWASNSFGSSSVFIFEEGFTDSGIVKTAPAISGAILVTISSMNDGIQFSLDDAGGNVGNLSAHYYYVLDDGTFSGIKQSLTPVTPSVGIKTVSLASGDEDKSAVYFLTIESQQGFSQADSIDNVSSGA